MDLMWGRMVHLISVVPELLWNLKGILTLYIGQIFHLYFWMWAKNTLLGLYISLQWSRVI